MVDPGSLTAALNWDQLMDPGDEQPLIRESEIAGQSFEDTRRMVDRALEAKYAVRETETSDGAVSYVESPWILEIGPDSVIVEWQRQNYRVSYAIQGDEVLLGDMEPVEQAWIREDGTPVALHVFDVQLGAGDEADAGDDGLIWKEILRPGRWFKMDSGRPVEVLPEIIEEAYLAFEAGLPRFISVPTDHHHLATRGVVPPESNRGFVRKLKMVGDRLFAGFELLHPEIAAGVQDGTIVDCSVYLQPNVVHPTSGKRFQWVLRHVLLTNDPLVQDLAPFGEPIPASGNESGAFAMHYQAQATGPQSYEQNSTDEEVVMPEQELEQEQELALSAEEIQSFREIAGLGLSAEEIKALAAQRMQVRQKARELEVTQIVRALEGVEEHPGVTRIEGYRHYPVVVRTVEETLGAEALALSADDEGRADVDSVVLSIVNAIPEEGRLALAGQEGPRGNRDPQTGQDEAEDGVPSNEQIDKFAQELGI